MMSMARATSPNNTSLSPLTKAIFSARSLKICSRRGPRPSQVASSLLILTLPFINTCTTTVWFSNSWFCCWFGFGCGTRVSIPLGVSGVMTMKIISSTSRMSISGTTFISAIAPPLLSPTCIPIELLLGPSLRVIQAIRPRRLWESARRRNRKKRPQTNDYFEPTLPLVRLRRRWRRCGSLVPLGQEADLIDACRADFVDDGDHVAILGARVAFHVHGFVQTVGNAVLDLRGDFFLENLGSAKKDVTVASYGDNDGVLFIGILHISSGIRSGQVHRMVLLQHGRDHHEDDQQYEHDIRHRNDVGSRHLTPNLWLVPCVGDWRSHDYLLPGAATQDEIVDELHRGVVHLHVEGFHFVREIVVSPHRRDRDEKTERGGDQSFRDTAGDRGQTGGLALLDALERVQDADHRAEEADEWSRGANGRESREPALHFRVHDGHGALQAALGRFDDVRIGNLLRSRLEFGEPGGHHLGDVALLVALGDGDGFVQLAVFQCPGNLLNEHARLLARGAVHQRAVNHHAERVDGEDEKDDDHRTRQSAHLGPHGPEIPARAGCRLEEQDRININRS